MEPPKTFLELVREYVALIENRENLKPYEILLRCDSLLPLIYVEALRLPDTEPDPESPENRIEGEPLRVSLARILGNYDLYQHFYLPMFDREPCTGTLSDGLADIYCDLKRELNAYEEGRIDDAIWVWKSEMKDHTGAHITSAMGTIHALVHDHMDSEYENRNPREKRSDLRILEVGKKGISLRVEEKELFLAYKRHPVFEDALLGAIYNVSFSSPDHLRWPDLDVELSIGTTEQAQD